MASARTPYPEAARELLRQTLFGAARDRLEQQAWSEITMSDIAASAGVSRQTLYKEFGNRNEFGLAFVLLLALPLLFSATLFAITPKYQDALKARMSTTGGKESVDFKLS